MLLPAYWRKRKSYISINIQFFPIWREVSSNTRESLRYYDYLSSVFLCNLHVLTTLVLGDEESFFIWLTSRNLEQGAGILSDFLFTNSKDVMIYCTILFISIPFEYVVLWNYFGDNFFKINLFHGTFLKHVQLYSKLWWTCIILLSPFITKI